MIRSKDVNAEVKKLDDLVQAVSKADTDPALSQALLAGILKANVLSVKLLRDIKTNQVEIMKATDVKLIKDNNVKKQE